MSRSPPTTKTRMTGRAPTIWAPRRRAKKAERALARALREIENSTSRLDGRARKIRSKLIELGYLSPREGRAGSDVHSWFMMMLDGETAESAIEIVATETGRQYETVRRNISRHFTKLGVPPPVPIPKH